MGFSSEYEAAVQTAAKAGLGKGTTVVDNDLIGVAFMVGAGVCAGYFIESLELPLSQREEIHNSLYSFLSLCVAVGNDAL
jgi:hypothetical protein